MSLEKDYQHECKRTLEGFGGFAYKMVQDTTVCLRCHAKVYPHHVGWADYHGEIPLLSQVWMAVKVECKANTDRFEFNQLEPEQIKFMQDYKGLGFFWIQLGTAKAGSSNSMARQVWMIEKSVFFDMMATIPDVCGVNYIPINPEAIASNHMRFKRPDLTMETLFGTSKMEWIGDSCWRPNPNHLLWTYKPELSYDLFNRIEQ